MADNRQRAMQARAENKLAEAENKLRSWKGFLELLFG
jgi:hypothetical protein